MSETVLNRPFAEQHTLNRQVWERLVNDPKWNDVLEKVETDRDGKLIMSPPPKRRHARRANRIAKLLGQFLPKGFWQVEDPVSTTEGVKVPDVAWYGPQRAEASDADEDDLLSKVVPDLCVEILSPGNTVRDIRKKTITYFKAGVHEVWVCDREGNMTFFGPQGPLQCSLFCPDFPRQIPDRFLR
jgi:Uma2 family endonuclease